MILVAVASAVTLLPAEAAPIACDSAPTSIIQQVTIIDLNMRSSYACYSNLDFGLPNKAYVAKNVFAAEIKKGLRQVS